MKFNLDARFGLTLWDTYITPKLWLEFTITSLLAGLPVIIVVGLFINIAEANKTARAIRQTLVLIFRGEEKEIFSQLPTRFKEQIVRGTLENTLGKDYGSVVYDEIISPYLTQKQHYRRDFRYNIECLSPAEVELAPQSVRIKALIGMLGEQHMWIRQKLGYARHGLRDNSKIETLYLRIALDQDQLNELMGDMSSAIFFREVLRVTDEVKRQILLLDKSELNELVRTVFGLRIFSLNTSSELAFTVHWVKLGRARYIEVAIGDYNQPAEGSGCRIEIMLPQHETDRYFIVFLPRPIHSGAIISLKKSSMMHSLTKVPFLSEFIPNGYEVSWSGKSEAEPDSITFVTNSWMPPNSGVMFTWKQ